ncbi:MAG: 4-hydroxy-3-methylbut-2-en-1-yl diphosphate synthase [Gammaproteobacteria bacterium]|nr:MAG: 4-hydroxy-3-methylbut-2-en-1-yl diphosphate synthase [Gammaproteobacteria bacterium]RLA15704.1 MAG: 4-hydroxy-3-methylbut-2-en-1-yl diphosphate synthase [Gammaproteobacteria bacterium]
MNQPLNANSTLPRNPTRSVKIGSITIGAGAPIAVQSMCATKTTDIDATVAQIIDLQQAGAEVIRLAVDKSTEAKALASIREQVDANLTVDLQENYRMAEKVAPLVEKIRYNPGHLYHHEKRKPWQDKVRYLVDIAGSNDCAMRVGVNAGSVDPALSDRFDPEDSISPMIESALSHCDLLDELGFYRYCVSLKDSDPAKVIQLNQRFAELRPKIPLHLGVTEAGMPPGGIIKTRIAFEALIGQGIGDTIRVSLTLPNDRKGDEVTAGFDILSAIARGERLGSGALDGGLNIISCPSCSRVENEAFVDLAEQVKEMTEYAQDYDITIAVMGCRVNGPGETDDADLGLWCAPRFVNLKKGGIPLGAYPYDEILPILKEQLDQLISTKSTID